MSSQKKEIPNEWAKENRVGFYNWIYTTFHPNMNKSDKKVESSKNGCDCVDGSSSTEASCAVSTDHSMLPHQRFVRNYIHYESPYRGLLLYHGLGTGKSFSSIAAAEGFLNRHIKIIIMIPASLVTNYRQEIMRFGSLGKPSTKTWSLVNFKGNEQIATEHSIGGDFLKKHNSLIWLPNLTGEFPQKLYVKDKKQLKWTTLSQPEKDSATDTLSYIIDQRYTFVNYNGITKQNSGKYNAAFFENAFIIIDEAHNFISRVVNGGKYGRKIYESIMNARGIRLVLLSGTPIINHPYELSFTLNLIRGPMKVYQFQFLKTSKIPSHDDIMSVFGEKNLHKYIDQYRVIDGQSTLLITLLPNGFINAIDSENGSDNAITVIHEPWASDEKDIIIHIQNTLNILPGVKVGKRFSIEEMYAYPEKREDFNALFIDETDPENPKVKNMDLFMRRGIGIISYFRSAGEEYFPRVLPKIIEQIPMCNYQFSKYISVRDEERRLEARKKLQNRGGVRGLMTNKGAIYRAFSRMACNFIFPENIDRPFPKDLRKALQIEIDRIEEDTTQESPDEDNTPTDDNTKKKVKEGDVQKKYESAIKKAMDSLQSESDKYLSHEKLNQLYSSKFAKILDHINTSPGKALLYSQFRTIEGLGVMKLILERDGYKEIRVESKGTSWSITNANEVLSDTYNGKRFIIFDPDREKTRLLLHIYNGEFNALPPDLRKQLKDNKFTENLRGDLSKLLMITQSGAEGISLKCVRRVMIMEPFWNMVRMDQVIGRAVRTCSHQELPLEERNVQVYIYTTVFTDKQLKDNFTLRRLDLGLTSDAHILQIAEKKDIIIQTFLNHLKACAVDCRVNAAQNKPIENGFGCYSFPFPSKPDIYSFIPDIMHDTLNILEKRKKVQGRVVSLDGKKYIIVNEYPDKVFDYEAYKYAGVLEETEI